MLALSSFVAVLALVAVHLLAHRLRFLDGTPRSRWLSAAGGISLAYVFLHFLPELAEGQHLVGEEGVGVPFVEFELYGVALIGLIVFYGLERLMLTSRMGRPETPDGTGDAVHRPEGHGPFWVHLGSFATYNLITGYLLVRRGEAEQGGEIDPLAAAPEITLLTFAIAMALHFLVTDYGLREDYRTGYMRTGRWVLSGAIVAGWVIGMVLPLPELAVLAIIAFLGGGVILNVLKEELPAERQSRFGALLLGALAYALLLGFTR